MTKTAVALAAALLAATLAGCAGGPGERPVAGAAPSQSECSLAREEHPKLIKQFGGEVADANIRNYVASVGRRVAARSEMPDIDWHFTVLNSDIVNAFALPCGYVYITRGLLSLAGSEAELAGVLGHEAGHVTARHTAQRMERGNAAAVGATILGAAVGVLTGSGAAAQVAAQAAGAGAQVYLAGYSRDQEFQADELGVVYLSRASYDPRSMATFLEKLQEDSRLTAELMGKPEAADAFSIMQSHPRTPDRVRKAIEEAGDVAHVANPRIGREEYLRVIDGMAWGGDPDSGFVKNHVFIHPSLRFKFAVPPGFRMFNGESAVAALGPDNTRVIFDRVGRASEAGAAPLVNALRQAQFQNVEQITVDRLPAATGARTVQTRDGQRLDLRTVLIRGDQDVVWRFQFITPPSVTARYNDAFRATTYSFDQLTPQQAAAERPFRIRLARVGASDSQESIARRMAPSDLPLRRFQVLNGLKPQDRLQPGQIVKIITE
ncbi:MAG: M48 family metalloprotease [Alphaproteobacteria bacterium]|nr:M48 family metalloprotease [Alphaproteobacteria bacterium]